MKIQSWTTTIDNVTYDIEYTVYFLKKDLLVNNTPVKLHRSRTFGITRETPFRLGNKTAILVSIDNNCDIAIDGIFLNSGEKYVQVKKIPIWCFIYLGLIMLIFIFSYESICSGLFTLTGIYFLIRASIEPSLSTKNRIILCSVITLAMHLFFWGVLFILLSIL